MNDRQRLSAIMQYRSFDRLPCYYFGTWPETKHRWAAEGLSDIRSYGGSGGPQLPEMDEDWENSPDGKGSIWDNQGLFRPQAISRNEAQIIEETADWRIVRSPLGGVAQHSRRGSSIPHQIEADLKPTREDWRRFKRFLDPSDPQRWCDGWEARAARLRSRTRATCFLGGSLYGWLREWMGVEQISYLMYDDAQLLQDMVCDMADYFLSVAEKVLPHAEFDFAYIFEDCCGRSGPLIPPDIYQRIYEPHYRRMLRWYRDHGVPLTLLDSDGDVKELLPHWLRTGFDIIFPIEVGVWRASPASLRRQYGKSLRMMGGVDKHVIPQGEAAIRRELEPLVQVAREGGFIPMPDHRIPPDCSLAHFRTYVRVFKGVFSGVPGTALGEDLTRAQDAQRRQDER